MVLGRFNKGKATGPARSRLSKKIIRQEEAKMARPSPPGKRKRISLLEWIIVIGGVTLIIGYNRINLARLQRSLPNVNSKIVGEWKAERGPEHLLFRTDESVSLTLPGPATGDNTAEAAADTSGPPPVTGKYKLTQGGRIYIQLMNGKKYSTTISPINPNRFDLIDSETDGVTTFDRMSALRAGEANPAATPPAAANAPAAPPAPSAAEENVPATPPASSPAEAEAPSAAEAPPPAPGAPPAPEAPSR
jgi:hypothetical protein